MVEVVGIIVSTMTLAAGVIDGISIVKNCCRASHELEALQASSIELAALPPHQPEWWFAEQSNFTRVRFNNSRSYLRRSAARM